MICLVPVPIRETITLRLYNQHVIYRLAGDRAHVYTQRYRAETSARMTLFYEYRDALIEEVRYDMFRRAFCLGVGEELGEYGETFVHTPEFEEAICRFEFTATNQDQIIRHLYLAGMCSVVTMLGLTSAAPPRALRRKKHGNAARKNLFHYIAIDIMLGIDHSNYVALMVLTDRAPVR